MCISTRCVLQLRIFKRQKKIVHPMHLSDLLVTLVLALVASSVTLLSPKTKVLSDIDVKTGKYVFALQHCRYRRR